MTALKEDVCDGFVIGGGATAVMSQGRVAAAADKPFFLQLVGTGITFALHLGAVLSHARWPSVNCHQLFTHHMIQPKISVKNGSSAVPEGPGLGVELDGDALEKFRLDSMPEKTYPTSNLLLAVRWGSGATIYYGHANQYKQDFQAGRLPIFSKGVRVERMMDDGSREWRELYERAKKGGVHTN